MKLEIALFILFLVRTACFPLSLLKAKRSPASSKNLSMMSDSSVVAEDSTKKVLLSSGFGDRSQVNALILSLEKSNPTATNALEKIDGTWTVVYSGSLTDPGLLIYQVAKSLPGSALSLSDLTVSISGMAASSSCTAILPGNINVPLLVESTLEPYGSTGMAFKEKYQSGKASSFALAIPSFISSRFV